MSENLSLWSVENRSEWLPGTEPNRTEPMSPAEWAEVALGFLGVAALIVALVLMFSQPYDSQRWVHGHYEGKVWVEGHYEGARMKD